MSSKISFSCQCGQGFTVGKSHSGEHHECPKCGNSVIIPHHSMPPAAQNQEGRGKPSTVKVKGKTSSTAALAAVIGTLICAVGLLVIVLAIPQKSMEFAALGGSVFMGGVGIKIAAEILSSVLRIESYAQFIVENKHSQS